MGGKSTFLRQNALIVLLAQAGSYVPAAARDARPGRPPVQPGRRLGQSRARPLDLHGRDGRDRGDPRPGDARAASSSSTRSAAAPRPMTGSPSPGRWSRRSTTATRCRCLFATHYHELTRLAERLDALSLHHVRAREWKGELVLLHEVADGPADRSYGIAVAKLAGLPPPVLARAKSVLAKLEEGRAATGGIAAGLDDLPLFAAAPQRGSGARSGARGAGRDRARHAGPREALELVYRLKRLAGRAGQMSARLQPVPEPARRSSTGARLPTAAARRRPDRKRGATAILKEALGDGPRRDRAAARGAALCRHRGRRGLCLPRPTRSCASPTISSPRASIRSPIRPPRSGCC